MTCRKDKNCMLKELSISFQEICRSSAEGVASSSKLWAFSNLEYTNKLSLDLQECPAGFASEVILLHRKSM